MIPEAFSIKWFLVYYPVFGLLLTAVSAYFILKPNIICSYLLKQTQNQHPPPLLRNILKYLLLFTLPCLALSLYPFSWPEFIFSIWSLWTVYLVGSQLVQWDRLRKAIDHGKDTLPKLIRRAGTIMLSAALAIFILEYLLIKRAL